LPICSASTLINTQLSPTFLSSNSPSVSDFFSLLLSTFSLSSHSSNNPINLVITSKSTHIDLWLFWLLRPSPWNCYLGYFQFGEKFKDDSIMSYSRLIILTPFWLNSFLSVKARTTCPYLISYTSVSLFWYLLKTTIVVCFFFLSIVMTCQFFLSYNCLICLMFFYL
jgi:hypothetical protein